MTNPANPPNHSVCDQCGKALDEDLIEYRYYTGGLKDIKGRGVPIALFTCSYCKGQFCGRHRLPENHQCTKINSVRAAVPGPSPKKDRKQYVVLAPNVSHNIQNHPRQKRWVEYIPQTSIVKIIVILSIAIVVYFYLQHVNP